MNDVVHGHCDSRFQKVADALWARGVGTAGVRPSRLRGADGNQEFFLRGRFDAPPPDGPLL